MSVPEPGKITTPWANAGLKNTIPAAANPVTGRAGFDLGFAAINMTAKEAGGIPPFGQDFNGILFRITEALRYMQAGGRPTFSAAMATAIGGYPKGAVVLGSDGVTQYQNQTDGNTNNPDVTPTGWLPVVSNQYPVGAPIPWPTAVPPAGFLAMTGQSFSAVTYPLLALAYPALVLPDMRAEFIRGWDNGRGVDAGRGLLSAQGDDNKSHQHAWGIWTSRTNESPIPEWNGTTILKQTTGGTVEFDNYPIPGGGISTGSICGGSTKLDGSEARPRNISFNYIVRAA